MADPFYEVRLGFLPNSWGNVIGSGSTWTDLMSLYTWGEISSGVVPSQDILGITIEREAGTLFNRLQAGRCKIVLDNSRGVYSPERGFHNMEPRLTVSVRAITAAGSHYGLFLGRSESYKVETGHSRRHVVVTANDDAVLLRSTINQSLHVGVNVGSLAADVASAAGFGPDRVEIDLIGDQAPFSLMDDLSGGDAIDEIVRSGMHRVWFTARGKMRIRDRNFDFGQTAVASYSQFLYFSYSLDDGTIINEAEISGAPRRVLTSTDTVAWIGEGIELAAAESVSFVLRYLDPGTLETDTPVRSVFAVSSADYLFNASSGGGGADITDGLVVEINPFAQSALITATNGSSVSGTITKMQLRGNALRRLPGFVLRRQDTDSQRRFEKRSFTLVNDLIPKILHSKDYADYLQQRFGEPLARVVFSTKNDFPNALSIDLGDQVSLVDSITGVASEFIVDTVRHDIVPRRGPEHTVEYGGVIAETKTYLRLNDSSLGRIDDANTLGF